MAWWTALVNVAKKIAGLISGNEDENSRNRIVATNLNDIVSVCNRILSGDAMSANATENVWRSLAEQDPRVLQMSIKVLQAVLEQRGIHTRNESSELLACLRGVLRTTNDEGVRNSVIEMNNTWKTACKMDSNFQGVADILDVFNEAGYRVFAVKRGDIESDDEEDNRNRITHDTSECYMCDEQLPKHLQHRCYRCRNIFCNRCCTYQASGGGSRRNNRAKCICYECLRTDDDFPNRRRLPYNSTVPKVINDDNEDPRNRCVIRSTDGNGEGEEDGVQLNVVVPRDMAENPEGWAISIHCKKNENSTSKITVQDTRECKSDFKWSQDHNKGKLYEKDIWEENSNSDVVVTKSAMRNEKKDFQAAPQYNGRHSDTGYPTCGKGGFAMGCTERELELARQLEERDLQLAIERSKREEIELQTAMELSRKDSMNDEIRKGKKHNSCEMRAYDSDDDMYLRDSRKGATYKAINKKFGTDDSVEDSDEENASYGSPQYRTYSQKTSSTCWKEKKGWEEEEALQRAIELSKNKTSNAQSCSSCCKDNKSLEEEEEEEFRRAIELSKKEINTEACCGSVKDKKRWEEQEALQRAIELSMEQEKKVCDQCREKLCVCEEEVALRWALELSKVEATGTQETFRSYIPKVPVSIMKDVNNEPSSSQLSTEERLTDEILEEEDRKSSMRPTADDLRQIRLRRFTSESSKQENSTTMDKLEFDVKSYDVKGESCKDDSEMAGPSKKELTMMEEEAELKYALQLSLQEMLIKAEETESTESEDNDEEVLNEDINPRHTAELCH